MRKRTKLTFKGWIGATVLAFGLVACGAEGQLTTLAQETCEDLEDSIVLMVGGILERAVSDADELGFTAPELGAALREECPDLMLAVENIGNEAEARDERDQDLVDGVELELDGCFSDSASGTVKNVALFSGSERPTISVFIEVQFTDDAGVLLDTGLASVSGLKPLQTAEWEAHFFGGDYDRCRAEVSSVYED